LASFRSTASEASTDCSVGPERADAQQFPSFRKALLLQSLKSGVSPRPGPSGNSQRETNVAQILLIADEATCRSEFVSYLLRSGHEIECAHDAEAGLTASVRGACELVLLDIVDSAGGLSPLTLLREKTVVPVIVIGSSAETIDKVLALELGADDYVAKPFECLEIAARIQAVLRRVSRAHPNRPLRVGPLTLNSARCEVSLHQDKLHLKPIEFRILSYPGSRRMR
jgi:DNA-binding response OmpR family regulator